MNFALSLLMIMVGSLVVSDQLDPLMSAADRAWFFLGLGLMFLGWKRLD
jgi:hypothetical protein